MDVTTQAALRKPNPSHIAHLFRRAMRHWQFYIIILPALVYVAIFQYVPMYGIQIAFKDFMIMKGFAGSPWVGLEHFRTFFSSFYFRRIILNTLGISFYSLAAGFLPPIVLAVGLNECRNHYFKKTVQLVTYAPHFLSTVIVVGMVLQVLSYNGIVNTILVALGHARIHFMGNAAYFKTIYVLSGIWQNVGYSSILYIATLASINPELYEAATVDGCNIWQRIFNIDIPGIVPTAVILLIMNTASIVNVGFEKVFLMQNALNMDTSDVISTYVYRIGLTNMEYDFATAVNLFQSVVSLILITVVNTIARSLGETSLW